MPKTVPREKVDDLRAEALLRVRACRERPNGERVPRYILQMHSEQKHALVVDSRRSRLYVFENVGGRPQYIADYYVTLGKNGMEKTREGDQKTPIDVYHVTANLPRQKLTDFYGAGAFPINYPNAWDKRLGRNGHGIWLHGTPSDTYSRPPRAFTPKTRTLRSGPNKSVPSIPRRTGSRSPYRRWRCCRIPARNSSWSASIMITVRAIFPT